MKYLMKLNLLIVLTALMSFFSLQSSSANNQTNVTEDASTGFIVGHVWNDRNGDGGPDAGERGIRKVVVYIDANDNGVRDSDEISTLTNTAGFYRFLNLFPGDYIVRQEVAFGWRNVSGGEGESVSPTVIASDPSTRIIGGDESKIGEFPFMVAVGSLGAQGFGQFCGGVLITDRWVATAAHCSAGANPANVGVLAGTNNVDDGSGQVLTVKNIYLHPDFVVFPAEPGDPFSVSAGFDIALWELDAPVALEESGLQTVAMLTPDNALLADVDTLATTVGWGSSDLASNLLQDVHLPIFDDAICENVYASSINFETQICGAAPEGGIDACQGDSGGPLLVRDFERKTWNLAGVTSYGNGCALPGNPGVWARVSVLSDWAKEVAVEPSRVHRVTVETGVVSRANFGNNKTRFEPRKSIASRWQLVNNLVNNDPLGDLTFDWRIIDESKQQRTFRCSADADGLGPESPVVAPCLAGTNQSTLAPLSDGVFIPALTAELGDDNFSRTINLIIGSPVETETSGSLATDDSTDPDFPFAPFYIDYFDIANLSNAKAIAIRIESGDFDVFAGLYDRDIREANGGGGTLSFFSSPAPGEPAELIFFPDPNVNYVIGVSSFGAEGVGDYTITLLNDGTADSTTLSLPLAVSNRAYRKLPENRLVIPAPSPQ